MSYKFLALTEFSVLAGPLLAAAESGVGGLALAAQQWRPPEWSQAAMYMITVPADQSLNSSNISYNVGNGTLSPDASNNQPGTVANAGGATFYVFDAVLRAQLTREIRRTEHPIQTSQSSPVASITDHAYRMPARATLEIGMSDAMQGYSKTMWSTATSKSVSAYQILVDLQKQRKLITLSTRLETFRNMIIENITPQEDFRTRNALRASVTFSEIFLASMTLDDSSQQASARPQTTATTQSGTQQARTTPNSVTSQNKVSSTFSGVTKVPLIPGAGSWSSINVNQLRGLLG